MIKRVVSHEWLKPQHSAVTLELVVVSGGVVPPLTPYSESNGGSHRQGGGHQENDKGREEHLVSIRMTGKSLETMPRFVSVKVASSSSTTPPPSSPHFDSHSGPRQNRGMEEGWHTTLQGLMVSDGSRQLRFKIPLESTVRFLQLHFKGTVCPIEGSVRHLVDLSIEHADNATLDDEFRLLQRNSSSSIVGSPPANLLLSQHGASTPPPHHSRSTSFGSAAKESMKELGEVHQLRGEISELEGCLVGLQQKAYIKEKEERKVTAELYKKLQFEHQIHETRYKLEQHEYQLLLGRLRPNLLTPSMPLDLPISTTSPQRRKRMVEAESAAAVSTGHCSDSSAARFTSRYPKQILDLSPVEEKNAMQPRKINYNSSATAAAAGDVVKQVSPSAILQQQLATPPRDCMMVEKEHNGDFCPGDRFTDTVVSPVSSSSCSPGGSPDVIGQWKTSL